ncbi:hypothetical protein A2954_05905 [Candidatus Roizmanbacteria bacterium RIFCSPLOWO2_01_FULL_37_12]|uniref:Methyltransferase type 11 domain-containing protein n=1 Tax=Candidatus Roizmanbacteria bacterium RIFCSPLOWO2_01_FULL_37_12 TaxID=1802056 RepID=A0A1F7IBW4_9BACT|nr:MAG: hypothetical protein A2768_02645 [Candidatus Roizmanbacteria bacterium RIFCSPHIGHO2_01_FULL_37_16]OGK26003.1 MAG: hypothetical protein A3D76_03520 [Candidatus Roizmanbacteria bacterium RIFCSPHIGHO2_02_FULL_37_9b]OGK40840.1 MAG: hypothetical protein A2954_05905 [Candidatus Roizmanbacteria bacterium RIFCSPLOWO2_01_FULL_37_12]
MNYYNKKYFDVQKKAGMYGVQQDIWMYEPFIKNDDKVLDFGCGGGYMLERLNCGSKFGVDINSQARREAEKKRIKVFETLDDLPDGIKFNVIFSHHTLEHVDNPIQILKSLRKYLKKGGLIIVTVPIDDWRNEKKFKPEDVNQHLFTWTPLLLGNLFTHSGYKIKEIKIIERAWIPLSRIYYRIIPKLFYNFFSMLWSKLVLSRQIRIIAH